METLSVECHICGNVDRVKDSLFVLACHKCSVCQAGGGRVKLDDEAMTTDEASDARFSL